MPNNQTTASPVTRSAEVKKVIGILSKYLHASEWGQHTVVKENLPALLAYIVQLEASQPKPNPIPFDAEFMMGFDMGKEGGDMSALSIGYAEGGKLHVCALIEGEDAEKLYAALFQPKPESEVGLREALQVIASKNCGSDSPDFVDHIDHAQQVASAALSQAPVPTSGAVEAAAELYGVFANEADGFVSTPQTHAQATAIIQQYGDTLVLEAQKKMLPRGWLDRVVADALTQPPAADGKLALPQIVVDALAERKRQQEVEGWTPEHDDSYKNNELSRAAACYAVSFWRPWVSAMWPWMKKWWKPKTRRRDIERAIALLIAEGERLDRLAQPASGSGE